MSLISQEIDRDQYSPTEFRRILRRPGTLFYFFSLLILVVLILSLSDATLASFSISIYPRWRRRWRPTIREKCVIWKKKLKPIFFLNC